MACLGDFVPARLGGPEAAKNSSGGRAPIYLVSSLAGLLFACMGVRANAETQG